MPELRSPHSVSIGSSQITCSKKKMFVVTSTSCQARKSSLHSTCPSSVQESLDPSVFIAPERLAERIISEIKVEKKSRTLLILDCRPPAEFGRVRIDFSTAISVVLPSILHKRLQRGTLSPSSVIASKDLREWFLQKYQSLHVVLIPEKDSCTSPDENGNLDHNSPPFPCPPQSDQKSVSHLLLKKLRMDGVSAHLLHGGISDFLALFPHLSTGASGGKERPGRLGPLINLQSLSLEDSTSSSCSESCYSSPDFLVSDPVDCPAPPDPVVVLDASSAPTTPYLRSYPKMNGRNTSCQFPVEIVDYLYLGNAQIAEDRDTLKKNGISYILNVTPNLPNTFEGDEDFKYLQIPIQDHWSQNLASYFPEAIAFIDEARCQRRGVLVHCLAGISRSVTVTVAYLMKTLEKSLDEAYELVKNRKPNISPNFNFMGQLLDFERQLNGGNCSPDSGRSSCEISEELPPPEMHFLSPKLMPAPLGRKHRLNKDTQEVFPPSPSLA